MKKQLGIVMALVMITFIGFGIIIPVLPEVVDSHFHLNMMLVVYSGVAFLMSPLWGKWSDRFGRKPIIMIGTLGFSLSFLLLAVSNTHVVTQLASHFFAHPQLGVIYASRVFGGAFSGAVAAVAVAYIADITTDETRTKGMGLIGMSIGLGFIIGPGVGALLSQSNLYLPFYASAVMALIAFVVVALRLPESLSAEERMARVEGGSRWQAFEGKLKYLYVLGFFVSFSLAGLEGTLQFYNKAKFGATPADVGIMFLISGIVGAMIQGGVVRRYIKKGDESKFMVIGLLLSALGFLLLIFTTSFWTGALYLTVFSAGNSLIRPCVTSLITQRTTVSQGLASGLSSSMDNLGRIGGPLLGAFLYGIAKELPYAIGVVLSIAAVGLLARFVALDRKPTA
jgi:MFS family permease